MFLRFLKFIILTLAIGAFFCLNFVAVLGEEDLSSLCEWSKIEQAEKDLSREEYRALLEKCQKYYEQRTGEIEQDITKTQQEKKTLSNKITELRNKIKSLDYQIYQTNIMVKDLSAQIDNTQASINRTTLKIEDIQGKLANILQLRYEEDQKSTVEILLAEESLSGFFDNLVALELLNSKTQELLKNIKDLKSDLEDQKTSMDNEKKELENLAIIHTLQKQDSANQKSQQEYFLKLTEGEYQKYLLEKKDAEEKVTKIGNLLFELLEVPEGGIKFEDAVEISKSIAKQTGVRAAFLLAVLWQETRIGKLKGGCYLRDTKTGNGVYIKTGNKAPKTMHPSRDVPPFLKIIKELNEADRLATDAFHTPVSCCMIRNGSYFGWGGAMGPAQFIPSTWMLFKDEIEKITGSKPASPWSVRDAFLASALYLRNLGAGSQTYQKEIYSALKYFGCTSSWCRTYYGRPVMTAAECFQEYIDKGAMSVSCKDFIF